MRVLLVDDDSDYRDELIRGLADQGMESMAVDRGREALDHCDAVDVVLLDLNLPDVDGFEVCRLIRTNSSVPVIIVSGRTDEFDRVLSLRMGADDYVVKPCYLRELAARIDAVVRRAKNSWNPLGRNAMVKDLGELQLDFRRRRVTVNGAEVTLTRKEFDLLALLASEPGRTFTRDQIMREVWGYDSIGDTRTLGVHMVGLRRKLGVPDKIETVRGVGFRLLESSCGSVPI
ncbi:response regulator transcription factor [Actinomadura rayongensis]|uniref:Response regulator n=1 Tax=Actinomadura rayongensis TaxID=1429076 RepID=A0A6I4W0H3_9ACTN|nr:response regulator transcription factor [Actinomadura rayongensis]MXQ63013.1 response regulator [Actinomadura rayongensis]